MEDRRSPFKSLTGKPTEKGHLGRPRFRWEDNITVNLKQIGVNTGNWVVSAQDMDLLENPCEFGIEPTGSKSNGVS